MSFKGAAKLGSALLNRGLLTQSSQQASNAALRALAAIPLAASSAALPQGAREMATARRDLKSFMNKGNADVEKMFCFQCEQTTGGTGCTQLGNCGKTPEVSAMQDLLVYSLKGLAYVAHYARSQGVEDPHINTFINQALFSTLTNVNFDDARFHVFVNEAREYQAKLLADLKAAGKPAPPVPAASGHFNGMPHPFAWNAGKESAGLGVGAMIETGLKAGISARRAAQGATLVGLQETLVYGLKGLCAYAAHAEALGRTSPNVYAFVSEALTFLGTPAASDIGAVLEMCMRAGQVNLEVMQMLSEGHSTKFGDPAPGQAPLKPKPGKAILITGHDMADLERLLKQTEGTGVNVYTHGEMLPAFSYPGLRKYKHLAGHYGGAWYRQKIDFANFPGAILVTTNCVLHPLQSYQANLFTTNETGLPGVSHVSGDYSKVIARAQELPGFTEEDCKEFPDKSYTVGFGHKTVLSVADQVVDAFKTGKLEHIFLVGGCDGAEGQRKYYEGLGKNMPQNTMLLTLGCGKFRILDQEFGTLPGTQLPRLLDMGQCNDSYSALVVATELAKVFNTDVNKLPLSLDISWFEQKAVAVLLTLLSLGVRNIRLGPKLPAFLTQDAVQVLVDKFNLIPADVEDPANDLKAMMAPKA